MAVCRMHQQSDQHIPVMLHETVSYLVTKPEGTYIDATFGRGNHTQAILNQLTTNAQLIAFDKDPDAISYATHNFSAEPRFKIFHASFSKLGFYLKQLELMGKVDGILFDLGLSSPQLDNAHRGFSFSRDGKLDMRMDISQGQDAAAWLASVDEASLAEVLWKYGEERYSRRIARAIVEQRLVTPINTTLQLAELIKSVLPKQKFEDKHPATRSFQAIRIFINQELSDLEAGLQQAYDALAIGGRLVVISFHSLEDRIVKQFIKLHEKGATVPRGLPIKESDFPPKLKAITKAIKPSLNEIKQNPRARSAILRIAEKLS